MSNETEYKTVEQRLGDIALTALINRACEGDANAITFLNERGLIHLPELALNNNKRTKYLAEILHERAERLNLLT